MLVGCGWFVCSGSLGYFYGFGMFFGCSCLRHDGTESSQSAVLTMVLVAFCVDIYARKGKVPRMVVVHESGFIGILE